MPRTRGKLTPNPAPVTRQKPRRVRNKRALTTQQRAQTFTQVNARGFPRSLPAAVVAPIRYMGMSDIYAMELSYTPCNVYVGNGTIGSVKNVYPQYGATGAVFSYGLIAIAPSDSILGDTYVADVMKHYTRRRIRKMWIEYTPYFTSTAVNGVLAIAPLKAGADAVNVATSSSGSAPFATYTNTLSMAGVERVSFWDHLTFDVTRFIGGGSGANQDEFNILNGDSNQATIVNNSVDGSGIIPMCFVIGGYNTDGAMNGNVVGSIICRAIVDLIDYRGAFASSAPLLKKPQALLSQPSDPVKQISPPDIEDCLPCAECTSCKLCPLSKK